MTTGYVWLIIGVVLFAMEAFGLPGIGLMFAGIGALAAGIGIQVGLIAADAYALQGVVFLLATAAVTVLLWKPIQKFRLQTKQKPLYDTLIGGTATVIGGPLIKGTEGQISWSGTIMKAELAETAPFAELPEGTRVTIVETRGSMAMVVPK